MKTADLYLGIDYGERQIGVAVGQHTTGSARPLCILAARQGQPDWSQLAALLKEWQPQAVVIGLPLHMDGSEGESAARARKFAARLHGRFGCVVELHDERLSSREARANLQRSDGGKKIAHDKIDALAAALILQSWLARR